MMHRIWISTIFTLFVVSLFASGCATAPLTSDEEEMAAERFEPAPGLGNLYIVRKTEIELTKIEHSVKVNGQYIGVIDPRSYHLLELPPGRYTVSVKNRFREVTNEVQLAAGQNYFLQVKTGLLKASDLSVEQVGDENKGKEMVSAGNRLVTLPIVHTLLLAEIPLQAALDVPAVNLAQSYLSVKHSVRFVRAETNVSRVLGGVAITEENIDAYRTALEGRLSVYEQAIRQRGFKTVAGRYNGKATEACARSQSAFAGLIYEQEQKTVEITQDDMDASVVVMVEVKGKELNVKNPAAVAESTMAVNDAMNSDYFFRGEIKDNVIVFKPDVSVLVAGHVGETTESE